MEDMFAWVAEKRLTKPTLDELTRLFEVLQVKYGSRWLSYLALAKDEMILIEDPADAAKKIYGEYIVC